MAKVDLDLVKHILQRNDISVRQVSTIIEELEEELKIQKEENPPTPQVKKQFAMIVSDPEQSLPQTDLTGWVVQLPEDENVLTTEERICQAAYAFNQTPKGRRMPVASIGEACEVVPPKLFKEQDLWVKTREPILVLRTDNALGNPAETA